jgi:hypothetical protein
MTIRLEKKYLSYIENIGVGAKDKTPGATPKSYVSFLRIVSSRLGIDISPETIQNDNDILGIASRLEGKIEKGTIDNCKTALRKYLEMLDDKQFAEDKISKICWNSEGWSFPSGSKGKSAASSSFEAKYGYGHEEWLFDKSRIIDGYHYAFLQPLNLKSDKHVGKIYNIYLFTITNRMKYFVGLIRNALCISKDESGKVYRIYKKSKWLKGMVEETERAGAEPITFNKKIAPPEHFFNIKFKFEDVIRHDDLLEISDQDINISTTRYKLLSKSVDFKFAPSISSDEDDGNFKNTDMRYRTYKVESSFDPYHDKMQNALCELLRNKYKDKYKNVRLEKDRVDIKAKTYADRWHYYEIKTNSPKLSIRNALGQIMEYAYWPDLEKAEKLIIVSDNIPDQETIKYLNHIRIKFRLPVYYRFFDMQMGVLSEDY